MPGVVLPGAMVEPSCATLIKLGLFEAQHMAVFLHGPLQAIGKSGGRIRFNIHGDPDLDASLCGELLNDLIDHIGKMFLGQEGIKVEGAVEVR